MVEVGNGHKSTATAIADAIMREYGGRYEVGVIDSFKEVGCHRLDALYKESWKRILGMPRILAEVGYLGWRSRLLTHGVERLAGWFFLERLARRIETEQPVLVYSTYFFTTHFLSLLRRRGMLKVPVIAVNPDPFDTNAAYWHHEVDGYICFSQQVERILRKRNRCPDVQVFGYPVHHRFAGPQGDAAGFRAGLGLKASLPTVLMTAGGEGVGPLPCYVSALLQAGLPVQAVVVCGRNDAVKQKIEGMAAARPGSAVRVIGYAENMPELIAASDLVVGKAGPSTTFEALISGKPIIHTHFMPEERGTTRFVLQNRLGWYAPTPGQFVDILGGLLDEPDQLRQYTERVVRFGFRNGAEDIGRHIVGFLERRRE